MSILNDDTFAYYVAEEVKNKLTPLHKQLLMEKGNWDRWRDALVILSDSLQQQIDDIEIDSEADKARFLAMGQRGARLLRESMNAYQGKIKKIKRFKFHVDKRLDEVQLMIESGEALVRDGWQEVEFLKRAIAEHRSMLRDYDLEETSIDRALWAALDNRWEFDRVDVDNL
jgi:hypothetical protein